LSELSKWLVGNIIAVGGWDSSEVDNVVDGFLVPALEVSGLECVGISAMLTDLVRGNIPTEPNYVRMETDYFLLDPRLPGVRHVFLLLRALQMFRHTGSTYILPVSYHSIEIGGSYPSNLKQRLGRNLWYSTTITVEVWRGRSVLTNLRIGQRVLLKTT